MKSEHFLKEGFVEDASDVHADHEVQMARSDLFHAAEDALVLHKLLRNVSEQQGLEGWVAAKITLASDYLKTVREYIEYELMTAASEQPMLPIAEGSGSKEKQKTPYRDINSPEHRAAADKQKQQMAKDAAAEPGKKLADKIAKKGVAEGAPELLKQEMPLVRHIERELAQHGYEKGTPEYNEVFKHTISMYRQFGNVDAIKKGVAEAAKWRQGYRASGHPPGYQHKSGEIGPLGGTYDTTNNYGDEVKVPVNRYRDEPDRLADREKTKLSTSGKPLTAKNAARNLKTAIAQAKGRHGPVGVLPEQGVVEGSDEKQSFKVSYYNPKTRQDKVVTIKAPNKDEVLDYCANKGYKNVHVEQGVSEDDSAVQSFLSKGGKIQQLPYKKPRKADKTDYGSKHIGGSGDKMKASRTGTAAKTQGNKVAGMSEGSACNQTMEGKSCPMHGLKECPGYKSSIEETTAGSVAGVVNPTPKNKAKVGTLFGGTYKQKKTKA